MAAEAVFKIKEAEDKAKETVKKASDEAKRILADAREENVGKKKAVLEEALREKAEMIQREAEKANKSCAEIAARGAAEKETILAPESSKLECAVKLVMERIVGANGNR